MSGSIEHNIRLNKIQNDDVAIIGIDCKLPDVEGTMQLWESLTLKKDHLKTFPKKRCDDINKYYKWLGKNISPFRLGNYLNSIDEFDFRFFNITPREASMMNPNQRILLQTVYRAIQDAGYSEERIKGSDTGLYIGYIGDYDGSIYSRMVSDTQRDTSATGCLASMMAGRISYLLDLKGPAEMIDTACSSSLVAIYHAYQSLIHGDCKLAIAASVRTVLDPRSTNSIGIESKSGETRVFDENAEGTGIGEGSGAVVLKPLRDAINDGDLIYATIKGGAINQDGNCIGLTAPNVNAQIEVLKKAWSSAGVLPDDISYIEAHGTGTVLGDPIEIDGLNKALKCYMDDRGVCRVGSVKSNFGHLYDCSGLISLIKIALMLKNKTIVPTVHFNNLNPNIDLSDSPICIADEITEWSPRHGKRISGVSAFGFSGTNCHLVLEEASETEISVTNEKDENIKQLFVVSAKSVNALYKLLDEYRVLCYRIDDAFLSVLCQNTQIFRSHYDIRVAIPVSSMDELRQKLSTICDYQLLQDERLEFDGIYFGIPQNGELKELPDNIIELAKVYIAYRIVDFDKLYYHQNKVKMRLPLYPFDRECCWIDIKDRTRNIGIEEESDNLVEDIKVELTGRDGGDYSDTEKYLAKIFYKEMGYSKISVFDDFYTLGGDSIGAYHIVNQINSDYKTSLTMADILKNSTIQALAVFIEENNITDNSLYHIVKSQAQTWFPLSYAQQRMYILYLKDPNSVSYNMPFTIHFEGKLDVDKFEQVCRKLVELHDIFRTHYAIRDGIAMQCVDSKGELEFTHYYGDYNQSVLDDIRKPFDLEKDVLIRVTLFHVKENMEYVAFIDMNHISADGSSLGVLINDIVSLYKGNEILKQEIQYKDFALWQKNFPMQNLEKFWLNELKDLSDVELPIDHMRAGTGINECNILSFEIEKNLYLKLEQLCIDYKVSMFSMLFAVYQASLSKFMNTDEVVTGTPISCRTAIETQKMVGMFVNVMPFRIQVNKEEKLKEYLTKVHEHLLEILKNQDYPFDLLVDKLQIKRDVLRNPIFDTVFAFQNMRIPEIDLGGIKAKLNNEDNISKFDITVEATEKNEGLEVTLKYDTRLFDESTIQRFSEILRTGYMTMISNTADSVGDLFANIADEVTETGFEDMEFSF